MSLKTGINALAVLVREAWTEMDVRRSVYIAIAALLAVTVMSGQWLSCAALLSSAGHSCCHTQEKCPGHPDGATPECVSPAVDLAKAEQATGISFDAPPLTALLHGYEPAPARYEERAVSPPPATPPDLCLLNSVLTL